MLQMTGSDMELYEAMKHAPDVATTFGYPDKMQSLIDRAPQDGYLRECAVITYARSYVQAEGYMVSIKLTKNRALECWRVPGEDVEFTLRTPVSELITLGALKQRLYLLPGKEQLINTLVRDALPVEIIKGINVQPTDNMNEYRWTESP